LYFITTFDGKIFAPLSVAYQGFFNEISLAKAVERMVLGVCGILKRVHCSVFFKPASDTP
jgi:hypothetical protein